MGYTTDFFGELRIEPALNPAQIAYINQFSSTRRMKRKASVAETMSDPVREAVGLPIGIDGEFFVGSTENCGQNKDASIVEYNGSPSNQPGLWCQWIVSEDGTKLAWDGGEKFYSYVEWLQYMIKHFFDPWNCVLNGEIAWQGEESGDSGKIIVVDNSVRKLFTTND